MTLNRNTYVSVLESTKAALQERDGGSCFGTIGGERELKFSLTVSSTQVQRGRLPRSESLITAVTFLALCDLKRIFTCSIITALQFTVTWRDR